jgi:hypothetical protein
MQKINLEITMSAACNLLAAINNQQNSLKETLSSHTMKNKPKFAANLQKQFDNLQDAFTQIFEQYDASNEAAAAEREAKAFGGIIKRTVDKTGSRHQQIGGKNEQRPTRESPLQWLNSGAEHNRGV